MEADSVGFMEPLQVPAHLLAEDAFKRDLFYRSHVDLDAPMAKRSSSLKRDKARADHDGFGTRLRLVGDRSRVANGTKGENIGMIKSRKLETVRLAPRGEEQPIVGEVLSVGRRDFATGRI